jgi:plasmid stabilization system protein ParE
LDAFAELAAFPGLGRARPEYGVAIRSHRVRQHVVIYQPGETVLRVVRVLHVRRDVDGELGDEPP